MVAALTAKQVERTRESDDLIAQLLSSEDPDNDLTLLDGAPTDRLNLLATQLIARRQRQNTPIRIDVSGLPHEALIAFADELEKLGISYDLSADLIAAVKEYWIRRGASFTRAVRAKPIWIVLDVADRKPEKTFRNGLVDVVALTGTARVGEFATTVTRTLAYGGSGTTSNAGADRVFDSVWGKMSVWLMTESPSRQDLDGLDALGAALTGIAGMAGGGLSAKDIQNIIRQVLKESGPEGLSPDTIDLIDAIMKMKEAASAPNINPDVISQLSRDIARLIETGAVPPALMQAVTAALTTLSDTPGLSPILIQSGLAPLMAQNDNMALNEAMAEIVAQLKALSEIDSIDDALKADINKIIHEFQESLSQEGAQPAVLLAALQTQLVELSARVDLTAPFFTGLADILPAVADTKAQATAMAEVALTETTQTLTDQVAEMMTKIETGELNPAELPPEIQNLIESLGGVEKLQTTLAQENGHAALQATLTQALQDSAAAPELALAITAATPLLSAGTEFSALSENAALMAAQMEDIVEQIKTGEFDPAELPPDILALIESLGDVDRVEPSFGRELPPIPTHMPAPVDFIVPTHTPAPDLRVAPLEMPAAPPAPVMGGDGPAHQDAPSSPPENNGDAPKPDQRGTPTTDADKKSAPVPSAPKEKPTDLTPDTVDNKGVKPHIPPAPPKLEGDTPDKNPPLVNRPPSQPPPKQPGNEDTKPKPKTPSNPAPTPCGNGGSLCKCHKDAASGGTPPSETPLPKPREIIDHIEKFGLTPDLIVEHLGPEFKGTPEEAKVIIIDRLITETKLSEVKPVDITFEPPPPPYRPPVHTNPPKPTEEFDRITRPTIVVRPANPEPNFDFKGMKFEA